MNKVTSKLVLIPSPAKGHLVSALQFANQLLNHTFPNQLSITILIIPFIGATATATATDGNNPLIEYIQLPILDSPLSPDILKLVPEKVRSEYISCYTTHVRQAIAHLNSSQPDYSVQLVGLVVDMFCSSMIDVANEFNVPSYLFFTSGAAFLGLLYYLETRHDRVGVHVLELETESIIPCYVNSVPTSCLPTFAFDKEGHDAFVSHARRYKETKGIFINTFVELESYAMKSLRSLVEEGIHPPVYAVGPIVDLTDLETATTVEDQDDKITEWDDKITEWDDKITEWDDKITEWDDKITEWDDKITEWDDKITEWLDKQPTSSVILLSFGSAGAFRDKTQIREIALGLERSGQRFVWSLRQAPPKGKFALPSDYDSYEEILPPGYLERIGDQGMICGWVPQLKVLAHRATGGFVSHCGWNSILESLWFGVPIVAWPLYAEQQINAFQLARDLGLAIELALDYRMNGNTVVCADDIEKALTCVADKDGEVRKRVEEMGEMSRRAMSKGGTSYISYRCLINNMLGMK